MIYTNIVSEHWAATVVLSIFALMILTAVFLFIASIRDQRSYHNQSLPMIPGLSEEEEVVESDSPNTPVKETKVTKEESVFNFDEDFDFEDMDEDSEVILKEALKEQDEDNSKGSTKVNLSSVKKIKFLKGKKD